MGLLTDSLRMGGGIAGAFLPERKAQAYASTIPTWQSGHPQPAPASFERFAREGYQRNELVYACVEQLCTSAGEPRLMAYRKSPKVGEKPTPIPDHPILQLFERPNPFLGRSMFWQMAMFYRAIAGNGFAEKVRSRVGVTELWWWRPDRVRIIPDTKRFVRGYQVQIGADVYELDARDVIHFRNRTSLDDFYGMPPIQAAAARIDTDNYMREFARQFFTNAGVPAGLLTLQVAQTNQEREILRSRFRQDYAGPSGWHNLMIIDGQAASYTQMGMPLGERGIALPSIDEIDEARICAVFGVPLSIAGARLGMGGGGLQSRVEDDQRTFWNITLIPIYREFASAVNLQLVPEYDDIDYVEFDMADVKALEEDRNERETRLLNAFSKGAITREQFQREAKYGPPAEGEVYFVPIAVTPELVGKDGQTSITAPPGAVTRPSVTAPRQLPEPGQVPVQTIPAGRQAEPNAGIGAGEGTGGKIVDAVWFEGNGERKAKGNIAALRDYWQERFGSGHSGDFDDCVSTLSGKEGIDDPAALCAYWHHEATGAWPGRAPGEERSKTNGVVERKYSDDQPRDEHGRWAGGGGGAGESLVGKALASDLGQIAPRDDKVGPRAASEVQTMDDLARFAQMPPADDGQGNGYFTHAVRYPGMVDSILQNGIQPKSDGGDVWLSRSPLVRDFGAGYVVARLPEGSLREGQDVIERGLSYAEYAGSHSIEPATIVKVVRPYVYNEGGHSINEDALARYALGHQGLDDADVRALPRVYQNWFHLGTAGKTYDPAQPRDDRGKWTSGGGGAGGSVDPRAEVPTLTKRGEPTYAGKSVPQSSELSKQDVGKVGENVALAYLRQVEGANDARHANSEHNNFPVDLVYDHTVVEVKTGTIAAGKSAQQWRLTVGEPGKHEKALNAHLSADARAMLNADKAAAILNRKERAIGEIAQKVGHSVEARTLTVILNHDARTADVFKFDGFHPRIGWNSAQAKAGYVGTYSYA